MYLLKATRANEAGKEDRDAFFSIIPILENPLDRERFAYGQYTISYPLTPSGRIRLYIYQAFADLPKQI